MSEAALARDRLGEWCGWVLVGTAALTPLFAWLGPLGFAPLAALAGLLCLPALRVSARDLPLFALLALGAAWAALSMLWTVHRIDELEDATALKLALQVPLYGALWCGARRAAPVQRRLALRVFAWGLAAYGVLLIVEGMTGGAVYQALRQAIGDPIRPDLGRKNVAQGSFVLALLWPVAFAGGLRAGAPGWLALPMAAGTALLALRFDTDAPALAVAVALGVGALVMVWPRSAPRAIGVAAALLIVAMPLLVLAIRIAHLGPRLPLSWSMRTDYWGYALARVAEHPWRGWGLDASRAFSPYIQLHPHNGPLQVWLELGLPGVAVAALAWAFLFRRGARDERSLAAAAAVAAGAVYLLFACVSFGVWQEWWLALGALAAALAALGRDEART